MMVKAFLVPCVMFVVSLVLLGVAMLAPGPPRRPVPSVVVAAHPSIELTQAQRIRALEDAALAGNRGALRLALLDDDPDVAAVAAILARSASLGG